MKLSEIKKDSYHKILLLGPPGTGKTCFSAGMPLPIKLLDFDGKADSAALWYQSEEARLNGIDVTDWSRKLDDIDPIAEMNNLITKELIPQQRAGKMAYSTLVIDSITTFSKAVLRHIIKTNPGVKRASSAQGVQPCQQDYGILRREFEKLIPGLLSLPMNVVMTGHIDLDKSELTGEILRKAKMDGSFGADLPIYFKEVYRVFMRDGKPYAQTKSDLYYEFCRSQIPRLPNPVELKYENIIKQY